MALKPGVNYVRNISADVGGVTSSTINPESPMENGWTVSSAGISALEATQGLALPSSITATASGSCSLAGTPGC